MSPSVLGCVHASRTCLSSFWWSDRPWPSSGPETLANHWIRPLGSGLRCDGASKQLQGDFEMFEGLMFGTSRNSHAMLTNTVSLQNWGNEVQFRYCHFDRVHLACHTTGTPPKCHGNWSTQDCLGIRDPGMFGRWSSIDLVVPSGYPNPYTCLLYFVGADSQ